MSLLGSAAGISTITGGRQYHKPKKPFADTMQIAMRHLEDPSLAMQAVHNALSLLVDVEVRVRIAVGECLGNASNILGLEVWETAHTAILDNITCCWVSHSYLH